MMLFEAIARKIPYINSLRQDPKFTVMQEIQLRRRELGIDDMGDRLVQTPLPTAPINMSEVLQRAARRDRKAERLRADSNDPNFLLIVTEMFNGI